MACGCGSLLRTVPGGAHPANGSEPVIVDYPPPPAASELIPPDPGEACAWQDGHWTWVGRRYSWQPGRWVIPPAGCYYAGSAMVWVPSEDTGELYYLQPRWYPVDAEQLSQKQVLTRCGVPRPCSPAAKSPDGS